MKQVFLPIFLLSYSFLICQTLHTGLGTVTEGSNTGWRLIGQDPLNFGPIGSNAINLSFATEPNDTLGATGLYSVSMGINTQASGNYSTAMGNGSKASGIRSTATGYFSVASGNYSMAMGFAPIASGGSSFASGEFSKASGPFSIAMGSNATAEGNYSTAIGHYAHASGRGTTAIGTFNTIDSFAVPDAYSGTDRVFVIGNGTTTVSRSDALTVLFNGNTTIAGSVTAPFFIGDGSGLTNLPDNSSGLEKLTELGNTGWRVIGRNANNYGNIGEEAIDFSYSNAMNSAVGATGDYSIAMGNYVESSGDYSVGLGSETVASGYNSTALGYFNFATGNFATSMGISNTSSGIASTSMGFGTKAAGYATTSLGSWNTIDGTAVPAIFDSTNRALVIGNGTAENDRSDALTILFNGTTHIAGPVTAPFFIGDGSQLTNLGLKVITEQGNTGWRLTGQDSANYGNIGSGAIDLSISGTPNSTRGATGTNSFAAGDKTTASGNYSTAMGTNSKAIGNQSTALGYYSNASAEYSTAMGGGTTASGELSTAMGLATNASGLAATAMGYQTTASGAYSCAMGEETEASGYSSTSFGTFTRATGYSSIAMGEHSNASGKFSIAAGERTKAQGFGTLAIGIWNTSNESASPETFSLTNRAFVIGNGTSSVPSDAMTVLFDGTTTIAGDLTVNSDARLKSNVMSLGSTLSFLQKLDGKTYTFKTDESKEKIGLIAQDVQKVFPQLVRESKDHQRTLSINYQGFIPVVINAINELQENVKKQDLDIIKQQKQIEEQQNQIDKLTEMITLLVEKK